VDGGGSVGLLAQLLGQVVGTAFGGGEDDSLTDMLLLQMV
jgi:hypothetical protein